MIDLSLIEIASALDKTILINNSCSEAENKADDLVISFVCTDTRTIESKSKIDNEGTLFVALKGPHFDAHKFLLEAQELGVSALIVEDLIDDVTSIPQIQVKNTRVALAKISQIARNKSSAKFIGVTGRDVNMDAPTALRALPTPIWGFLRGWTLKANYLRNQMLQPFLKKNCRTPIIGSSQLPLGPIQTPISLLSGVIASCAPCWRF